MNSENTQLFDKNDCKRFWFEISVEEKVHETRAANDEWKGNTAVSLRNGFLASTVIGAACDLTIGKITKIKFGWLVPLTFLLGITSGVLEYQFGWLKEATRCRAAASGYGELRREI